MKNGTAYKDNRGWKFKVMGGIGGVFKGRYQKPEKSGDEGWKGVAALPWRNTFEEAQADLDQYAQAKGLTTIP